MILRNWYMLFELRRGTIEWEELPADFTYIFEFVDDNSSIDVALLVIITNIIEYVPVSMSSFHQRSVTI